MFGGVNPDWAAWWLRRRNPGAFPPGSYDSSAQAYFVRAALYGARFTAGETAALNTFVETLKADSLYAKLDVFAPLCLLHPTAARVCLIRRVLMPTVGAPVHTRGVGYTFANNIPGNYIETGFIPSAHGVAYTLNSAHGSVWVADNVASTGVDLGADSATSSHSIRINSRTAADGIQAGCNNTAGSIPSSGVTTSVGHTIVTRRAASGAGAFASLKNGSPLTTATTASVAVPSVGVWIGSRNNNGTQAGASGRTISGASLGGALSDADAGNFYTAFATFVAALGALA